MSHAEQGFINKYVFSKDHKVIGIQYFSVGFIMVFVAGFLAYGFRMQLAFPGIDTLLFGKMDQTKYNSAITMHGMIMFFWVAMPILLAGFGNLIIPLMIGADDMAFPVLNMLSFWVFLISTIILIASFYVPGGAFGGGWTMYPPLSVDAYQNQNKPFLELLMSGGSLLLLAVALEFVAMLMGGINFIVTTINMRAPGLTAMKLPILVWFQNIAAIDFMFSVGPIIAGAVMLLFDRILGTGFYDPARGGDPIMFQHLFWFFGHPEVYVVLLPAMGIVAEILSTFSRKPIFGYKMVVYMALASAFLAMIVWAHHQYIAGIDPRMATFFSITTILISIPFAHIMFSYIATLWRGSIRFELPMLYALGFLGCFLIGGVTGIYLGASAYDIYAHDTYFVVAHFHYTLIPAVIFGTLAGLHYWFPKFFARKLNKTLGRIHFWMTLIFFNGTFIPLFILGTAGQHRRVFDYSSFPSLMVAPYPAMRIFATICFLGLFFAQFILIYNIIRTLMKEKNCTEKNPWRSTTVEWAAPSPPPHGNFAEVPTVYHGAYEYSRPGDAEDFKPQYEK